MTGVTCRELIVLRHVRNVAVVYTLLRAIKLNVANFRRIADLVLGSLRVIINTPLYRPLRILGQASRLPRGLLDLKKEEKKGKTSYG